MANTIVTLGISVAGGIFCCLIAFASNYLINLDNPKLFVLMLMGIVVLSSYIIGFLLTLITYFTSPNKDKFSIGQVFLKALFVPLMNLIMIGVFALVPVLMGIKPPQYQQYPGESMTIIGAFRGIPESMINDIGEGALPISEMFYSFWGGLYGTSLAISGF
jgi:hypothetical protein